MLKPTASTPKRKIGPSPSGILPPSIAIVIAILLILVSIPAAFSLSPSFAYIGIAYFMLNLAYSFWLKHIPLVDVLVIAAGFVLRVAGGVMLIHVQRFSPWLYVVTTLLALYLGFGKRRAELSLLAGGAYSHRKVLDGYTIPFVGSIDHDRLQHDHHRLQPVHIFCAQPSHEPFHDVDHSICPLWHLPLSLPHPGQEPRRRPGRDAVW